MNIFERQRYWFLVRKPNNFALFHTPDIQHDALERGIGTWGAKEKAVVQPRILTICRSLKLRGTSEIERRSTVCATTHRDKSTVANVDIDAVIRLDAVDSLNLRTVLGIGQLVVGSAIDNRSLDAWAFESASSNRDDGTATMLSLATGISLPKRDFQL